MARSDQQPEPRQSTQQAELRSKDEIPLFYNQGIARIRGGWILTGTLSPIPKTDVIVRSDEHFNVVTRNEAAIPDEWRAQGYVHIGDIDVVGNVMYAPFEQPDYSKGHRSRPATTLEPCGSSMRSSSTRTRTHSSPSTRRPGLRTRWTTSTVTRSLRYDTAHKWRPLRPLPLSMPLEHTQGASIADGAVWISTSDAHNDIYRVNMKTGHVDLVAQITDPPGEGEGIAVAQLPSGYLHATVLDPDMTKVWVEHFSRP